MAERLYTVERLGPIADHPPPHEFNPADAPQQQRQPVRFSPTPVLPRDPDTLPPRNVLFGRHYTEGFVSVTAGAGGTAKTSLILGEALSMVSGKAPLGRAPRQRLRVWIYNLEDPAIEGERSVAAARLHWKLDPEDLDGLFISSGRDQPVIIASQGANGLVIHEDVIEGLIEAICEDRIDVLVLDPFVSCHRVNENDNGAVDAVIKALGRVAEQGRCAVHVVHHTRKTNGEAASIDSARGAKALIDGVRASRVLNPMTKEEAERAGLESPVGYFRADDQKMNHGPPADTAEWYRIVSVDLGNSTFDTPSDKIGVVTPWTWPSATDGVTTATMFEVRRRIADGQWREDPQSEAWAGRVVAEVLHLDIAKKGDRDRVKKLLAMWKATGALKVVMRPDAHRKLRAFIEPGNFEADAAPPREGDALQGDAVEPGDTAPPRHPP